VVVADGIAYVAAGIVNYDGTHVYALDAATGAIKWQNNSSGHLDPEQRSGVSVQGHMILTDGKLYLAGGNAVSPAVYDAATGKCLNEAAQVQKRVNNNVPGSFSARGSELYLIGHDVLAAGKPFYAHPQYPVYDNSVMYKTLLASAGDRTVAWMNNARLMAYPRGAARLEQRVRETWARPADLGMPPLWEIRCKDSLAIAVGQNAALVATRDQVAAHDLGTGARWWTQPLPSPPVPWGLAVDRNGRSLVTLENGHVLCFTAAQLAKAR
jgi:outer membrane protein assembly factor BamB